jgi:hypothetical protein
MTGESFAILSVILVMDVMLLRAGKKPVALLSLPLTTVPVFYLLAIGIGALIPVSADMLIPGMVLAGTLVGIAGCGALTLFIVNKAGKTGYFALGAVYLVALAVAYFMRMAA